MVVVAFIEIPGLLLVFLLVPLVPWVGAQLRRSRVTEVMHELAPALRLRIRRRHWLAAFLGRAPLMVGERDGRELELTQIRRTTGRRSRNFVRLKMTSGRASSSLRFRVSPEGWESTFKQLIRIEKVKTGDPIFDLEWWVDSNRPDFMAAALVAEVREHIRTTGAEGRFCYREGELRFESPGSIRSVAQLGRLRAICEAAHALMTVAEVDAADSDES